MGNLSQFNLNKRGKNTNSQNMNQAIFDKLESMDMQLRKLDSRKYKICHKSYLCWILG